MAVPKKKRSLRRRRIRRNKKTIQITAIHICSHCKAEKRIHYACPECGLYS